MGGGRLRIRPLSQTSPSFREGTASIGAYHVPFRVTMRELLSSAGFTLEGRIRHRVEQHRARLRAERRKRPGGRRR